MVKVLASLMPVNYMPGQFVVVMVEERGERIPLTILNDEGKLTGIVIKADLEAWYAHEKKSAYIVFDFMTKNR
ncbi:MAG: hypothetical protein ACUVQ8_08695 [Nitrososphaeria archaeon]